MSRNECTSGGVRDVLPLLASGGKPESSGAVEAHIAGCADCREELALLKVARQALLRAPAVDAASIARVVPAYARPSLNDPNVVPIGSRRTTAPAWRVAAAALLLASAGTALAVRQAGNDPATPPVMTVSDRGDSAGQEAGSPGFQDTLRATPAGGQSGVLTSVPRNDTGTEMTFGGGLDDLSEEELVALLAALEEGETLTPAEPEDALPSMSIDGEEEI